MSIVYLSGERFKELTRELKELKTKGRQEVARRLKAAKELGDLSENSEYQEARQEQSNLEQRIHELEEILRNAAIIKKSAGAATVKIGSEVKLQKIQGGETVTYTIVGSNEAHPIRGFVSNESPIGRGVLGKKAGDIVKIKTPKGGEASYKILSIE